MPDNDELLPLDEGTLYGPDYVIRRSGRIPWTPPDLNYSGHTQEMAVFYRRQNLHLQQQNTALLAIVSKLLGWFARRPMSEAAKGGYTNVPRKWWLEGETLLSSITLPVQAEESSDE